MVQRTNSLPKTLSPLVIVEGFLYGWAFDPLRSELTVNLSVDGEPPVIVGSTGFPVNDSFYALAVPPHSHAGFCLPLPAAVLDGFSHTFTVRVAEWQSTPDSPRSTLDWHYGDCFGEVNQKAPNEVSGWVGFRSTPNPAVLPKVIVSSGNTPKLTITLTAAPQAKVAGAEVAGRFLIDKSLLAEIAQPEFSCLGIPLRTASAEPKKELKIIGSVEKVDHQGITGWLVNMAAPLDVLKVVLLIDGSPHATYRPNVQDHNIARLLNLLPEEVAACAFDISLPERIKDGLPHKLELRCLADGTVLNQQPVVYQHPAAGITVEQAGRLLNLPALQRNHDLTPDRKAGVKQATANPRVSIIILNRNGAGCIEGLFASFKQHNTVPVEFIVIDHASTDASLQIIKKWQQQLPIRLEALQENRSFSASCNAGARLAKAPDLLFLNNDIVWLQDVLPAMLTSLRNKKVGAVGLRLLKTEAEFGPQANPAINAPVQHLGVRFTRVGEHYWPYELTPETTPLDQQFSPVNMPAVTAAVMLCSSQVFEESGGFDEHYFYGYEDVEFCLRLSQHLGYSIICRNDLTAMHHHGYTRLTGREPDMMPRHITNQQRLAATHGLWIKRNYWLDLVSGNKQLSAETFTVGLAINTTMSDSGMQQLAIAHKIALALSNVHPGCRVLILEAGKQWDYAGELHVLIALSPVYDLRTIQQARSDLRTALYMVSADDVEFWQQNPSLQHFDLAMHEPVSSVKKAAGALKNLLPVTGYNPEAPLGKLGEAPVRVVIRASKVTLQSAPVTALATKLKQSGLYVHKSGFQADPKARVPRHEYMTEVVISLFDQSLVTELPYYTYTSQPDVINILWVLGKLDLLRPADLSKADLVLHAQKTLPANVHPYARQRKQASLNADSLRGLSSLIRKKVEQKIGRTFHSS